MGSKQIKDITATQTSFNDTDVFILQENAGTTKKTVWSTIKSNLKTYFDSYYGIIPVGTILDSMSFSTPDGYLYANGDSVLRSSYASLFSAITSSLGTVTISSANPGVVTLNSHGLNTGDCVSFTTTGTLPTNLSPSTNYFVIYVNANTFRLATTWANANAATAIDTSGGSPSGTHTMLFNPHGIADATHFNLPDLRGVFLRADSASGLLSNANGTAFNGGNLGMRKNDMMQGHYHNWRYRTGQDANVYYSDTNFPASAAGGYNNAHATGTNNNSVVVTSSIADGTNGTPRAGLETQPSSITVRRYIKY